MKIIKKKCNELKVDHINSYFNKEINFNFFGMIKISNIIKLIRR